MDLRAKAKSLIDTLEETALRKFLLENSSDVPLLRVIPRFIYAGYDYAAIYEYADESKSFKSEVEFKRTKDTFYYSVISVSPDAFIYFLGSDIMLQKGNEEPKLLYKGKSNSKPAMKGD